MIGSNRMSIAPLGNDGDIEVALAGSNADGKYKGSGRAHAADIFPSHPPSPP